MRRYGITVTFMALAFAAMPAWAQNLNTRPLITIDSNLIKHAFQYPTSAGTPRHTIILLAGGNGVLNLNAAGAITDLEGNFLLRSAAAFHQACLNVAIVDAAPAFPSPSGLNNQRLTQAHADFIGQVVKTVRQNWSHTPVWLIATSNGTLSAVNAAARLTSSFRPDGIVLTSSITQGNPNGETADVLTATPGLINIAIPTLVIWHGNDTCPFSPATAAMTVFDRLPGIRKARQAISGGRPNPAVGACSAFGFHGYNGVEPAVVSAISGFIRTNAQYCGDFSH